MRRASGWAVAALLAGLASGCGPSAQEQRAMDQQQCAGYGFQPGTDAFANCLMSAAQHRDAQAAADRRAWEARQAADRQAEAARAAQQAAQQAANPKSDSSSGFQMPDLSGMNCTGSTTTSGSPNNSTTTTNTSCHN